MKKYSFIFIFFLVVTVAFSQQPNITNIDPVNSYPGNTVNIAGSGFGTTVGNIVVWFGGVEANVISVTDNLIEVTVPAQAPNDNVTVLNTSSNLLDVSTQKFFLSHSGTTFNTSDFSAPVEFFNSTTEEVFDICTCDFDNDGLPDIAATVSLGATEVKILKNTSTIGTTSFTEMTSFDFPVLDVSFTLKSIGCSDLNGDGKIDIYASRNGQEKIFVFENTNTVTGTMSFAAPAIEYNLTQLSSPYRPNEIYARDMTGDGKPELIISNEAEGSMNILVNTSVGSISFNSGSQEIFNLTGVPNSAGMAVEDFDNDGRHDIILTRSNGSDIFVLRNISAGSTIDFEEPVVISTGTTSNVTSADLNNDGLLDIVINELTNDRVLVLRNTSSTGSISFDTGSPTTISTGDEPWIAKYGDINGDGLIDIVVSNKVLSGSGEYTIAINNGNFDFSTVNNIAVSRPTRNLNVHDYDGDGKADIALTSFNSGDYAVQVIRNANCYGPVILNETPLAICPTQTIRLVAPNAPGAAFEWFKDAASVKIGTDNFLDVTASGVYDVEVVSEGGGCTETASITVTDGTGTVPSNPTASNNGPTCVGGDITLSVGTAAGATYSWSGPNGFTSTDQNPVITGVTVSNAGVYSVRVAIGDCQSSESTTTVEIQEPPAFSASASGSTTVCNGTPVLITTQNTAGYSFQWQLDGADITGATSSSYSATQSGDYTVVVSDNSSNCEVMTNSVSILVLQPPVASFDVTGSSCVGSDITFTSTSSIDANATASYSWNFADGSANGTSATEVHNYATAGGYDVMLTVSYAGGVCAASNTTQTVAIVDPAPLTIQASADFICNGEAVDLSIPGTFTNITWNTGANTNVISVNNEGTYSVTADDANGCNVSDTYDLVLGAEPTLEVSADGTVGDATIVSGTSVQLEATGADTYTWDPVDFLDDPDIANPVATPTATITYTVTGTLAVGCSSTAQITLTVGGEGQINIDPVNTFTPNGDGVNDTWSIVGVENYPDCTVSIFDERGSLVFRQLGYNNDWEATYEGNLLPEGVYYFVFGCDGLAPESGSILVVR